jgi:hypothetical protein
MGDNNNNNNNNNDNNSPRCRVLLEKIIISQLSGFMEPEVSLPCLK